MSLYLHRSYCSLRSGEVCVSVILRGCRQESSGVFKQFSNFQSYTEGWAA